MMAFWQTMSPWTKRILIICVFVAVISIGITAMFTDNFHWLVKLINPDVMKK